MRNLSWGVAGVLLLLLTPAVAQAQGIEIQSGQKVSMEFGDSGQTVHVYRYHAIEGDLVTIQFAVPKKSDLEPALSLIGPDEMYRLPDFERGKMKLSKQVMLTGGIHMFVVAAAGTEGAYGFKFTQKHAKLEPDLRPAQAKYSMTLPAGAKVKLEIKAAKGSDANPGIDQIVDPAGNDILDPDRLKEKKKKAKYTLLEAPIYGRYTFYCTDRLAGRGDVVIKAKISPAKPYSKKLSGKNAFESLVTSHSALFIGGGTTSVITAEIASGAASSAMLHFPEDSELKPVSLLGDAGKFRYESNVTTPGTYPDGIYRLVVTLPDGKTATKAFHIYGDWPSTPKLSVRDLNSETPSISWSGGSDAAVFLLEISENRPMTRIWEMRYSTWLPGVSTSHLVPDGPLNEATHEVTLRAITAGCKTSYSIFQEI